jgi:hypothetical protein
MQQKLKYLQKQDVDSIIKERNDKFYT